VSRPRPCARCGIRPIAYTGRECCYVCVPRRRNSILRCQLCGSDGDYYTAGRCRRCHRSADLRDSCRDCLAWGVTRRRDWRCEGCHGWHRRFGLGEPCPSCHRLVVLNARGFCRLCTRQATRTREPHQSVDVVEANRDGQQLFLADLFRAKRPEEPTKATARHGWPLHYPVPHRQLILFEAQRDLLAGRKDRLPLAPLPDLMQALEQVTHDHAAKHGWTPAYVDTTRHSLQILLALQDTPGAPISYTEAQLLSQLPSRSVQPIVEILDRVGMLSDDRPAPLENIYAEQTAGLPEPMASELRTWFLVLRDGSTVAPRSQPRTHATVRNYLAAVAPVLHRWHADGHTSLREITRDDLLAALPTHGHLRRQTISALRSLFRLLKARRIVFLNPTARLSAGPVVTNQPLPMNLEILREAVHSSQPDRAALATLLAFHAPRVQDLRRLQLIDVVDGRLTLPTHSVLLAAPVKDRLRAWLDERGRRWPNTINPHLFVNRYTAVREGPVSRAWTLSALGLPANELRNDRILHEAIATEGDIRRLCDLFGISVNTALRYLHSPEQPADPEPERSSANRRHL
jgi:hypothetical protein